MASIKGIQIKNVKSFRGNEWPENFQGNVYFNGKKMGFWSQDSWGGPDYFEFDTTELDKKAKEFYGENSIYGLDCLMGEILALADNEKQYKRAIKDGFSGIVVITDGYLEWSLKVRNVTDKDAIQKMCAPRVEEFKKESHDKENIKVNIFTELADFIQ